MFHHDVEFFSFESFDGIHIAGQRFGRGDLDVVLANGLGGNYLAWQPIVDCFGDRCRFWCWDYRGLYASERPPHPAALSIRHHARDMLALVEHCGLERAVWMGWSMGVQVQLEAFRLSAERCRSLVILNGTYGRAFHTAFRLPLGLGRYVLPVVNELGRVLAGPQSAIMRRGVRHGLALPFFRTLKLISPRIDRALFNRLARDVATIDLDTFHRCLAELDRHDAGFALADIGVPVLILAGDADLMTPHNVTDRMVDEIPHAELHVLRDATHYALLEVPEEICALIGDFLNRHGQGAGAAA